MVKATLEQPEEKKPDECPEPPANGTLRSKLAALDARVFMWCFETTRNRVFDAVMPALSIMANHGLIQIVTGTALFIAGLLRTDEVMVAAALCMLAAAGAAGIIAELTVKRVWHRQRPFQRIEGVDARVSCRRLRKRPSFPSGHAAGYMAAAVALAMFYPALAAPLVLIALLGGYSRIYNGVHFPTDVAAGLLVGAACGVLAVGLLAPLLI